MNRRRHRRESPAPRVIALVVAAAVAVALMFLLWRGLTGLLGGIGGGPTERDPMFPDEMETTTRPPEPDEAAASEALEDDPSLLWVYEAQTPVDKTAEELAREEAAAP